MYTWPLGRTHRGFRLRLIAKRPQGDAEISCEKLGMGGTAIPSRHI